MSYLLRVMSKAIEKSVLASNDEEVATVTIDSQQYNGKCKVKYSHELRYKNGDISITPLVMDQKITIEYEDADGNEKKEEVEISNVKVEFTTSHDTGIRKFILIRPKELSLYKNKWSLNFDVY